LSTFIELPARDQRRRRRVNLALALAATRLLEEARMQGCRSEAPAESPSADVPQGVVVAPEVVVSDLVFPPMLDPKYGESSEPSMSGTPAARRAANGWARWSGSTPRATLEVGHASNTTRRRASSMTSSGSSAARTPWLRRLTPGSRSGARTLSGPACSPGVDRAPQAAPRPPSRRRARRIAGLVAAHVEGDDVGVADGDRPASDVLGSGDAEVAHEGGADCRPRCHRPGAPRRCPSARRPSAPRRGGRRPRRGRAR
jgi:hypothetical protein